MRLLFLIGVVVWQATSSNAVIPLDIVIDSINIFSNNVLKAIVEDVPGNLICSAVGADMVLAMATFGARGHTEQALRSALALHRHDWPTLMGYRSLQGIFAYAKDFEIRVANKMYLAKGFELNRKFGNVIKWGFWSSPENIDFGNPSKATKIINHWTEVETNNHIKDLVKEDDFNSDTALVLVNAIYFKASWELQFDEYFTRPRPFHVNGEILKNVLTMMNTDTYRFGELPDAKAKFLEIEYTTSRTSPEDVSMFIILPDEIDGIGELVKNLKKICVKRLLRGTKSTVTVHLPKFKIESTIDLQVPLTKMGLGEIFTDSANFTGIAASPPLKVSKILQKAFIDVNERGTEAAAATISGFSFRSGFGLTNEPIDFKVDHPFVALIATKRGLPLFSSVVMEPIYYGTKLKVLDAQLSKLDATLRLLDVEFEACETLIVDTLISREALISRVHSIINILETTLTYRQYAENARKKLDEKCDEVSMQLRDPNLDAEREQQLQETIENLAEIQDDLGKTERGVELSHAQCVRFEAHLNVLINTNESMHRRLCEMLVYNERSCREVLAKKSRLRAAKRAIEDDDSHEI